MKNFSIGEYPYKISATIFEQGSDLILCISGGTKSHIGAVAIAEPDELNSATASIFSFRGHREDLLAREAALKFAREKKCRVVSIVGIHIDNASREQIEILQKNFRELLNLIE